MEASEEETLEPIGDGTPALQGPQFCGYVEVLDLEYGWVV